MFSRLEAAAQIPNLEPFPNRFSRDKRERGAGNSGCDISQKNPLWMELKGQTSSSFLGSPRGRAGQGNPREKNKQQNFGKNAIKQNRTGTGGASPGWGKYMDLGVSRATPGLGEGDRAVTKPQDRGDSRRGHREGTPGSRLFPPPPPFPSAPGPVFPPPSPAAPPPLRGAAPVPSPPPDVPQCPRGVAVPRSPRRSRCPLPAVRARPLAPIGWRSHKPHSYWSWRTSITAPGHAPCSASRPVAKGRDCCQRALLRGGAKGAGQPMGEGRARRGAPPCGRRGRCHGNGEGRGSGGVP